MFLTRDSGAGLIPTLQTVIRRLGDCRKKVEDVHSAISEMRREIIRTDPGEEEEITQILKEAEDLSDRIQAAQERQKANLRFFQNAEREVMDIYGPPPSFGR